MKLHLNDIPINGKTIALDPSCDWVKEAINASFVDEKPDLSNFKGQFLIQGVDKNFHLHGDLQICLNPTCDRCLEHFAYSLEVPFNMNFAPLYSSEQKKSESDDDDLGLDTQEIEFAFYETPEIDLTKLLNEHIVLNIPIRFLCADDCKGLCSQCGVNLNQTSCQCSTQVDETSPWAELKKFKN